MRILVFRRPTFKSLKSNGHPALAGPLTGKLKNNFLCVLCVFAVKRIFQLYLLRILSYAKKAPSGLGFGAK
jgi:hypothetical protein